jgi:hypothetical protein
MSSSSPAVGLPPHAVTPAGFEGARPALLRVSQARARVAVPMAKLLCAIPAKTSCLKMMRGVGKSLSRKGAFALMKPWLMSARMHFASDS